MPGCAPVPLSGIENDEFVASLIIVMFPVSAPVDVGANCI